jgi:hypothetical protein
VGPVEVVIVAVMAASAAVLTPYDFLSYALIVATVVAAGSGRTVVTAGLAATAVATRESGLLVIAIILASCAASDPAFGGAQIPAWRGAWRSMWGAAARHRPLWAAAGAALSMYVVLKVVYRSGGGVILFQHVGLRENLTARSGCAIALAGVLVAAGRWASGPASAVLRLRRRVLWMLALPYLVVVALGGIWGEAPRLVVPLVLGEALLAVNTTAAAPVTEGSQT